ncbi:MAG: hypothetical protein ACKOWK_03710 [Micrococcales bacterium]
MSSVLLKFFGVLALFVVAGAYFNVPWYLSALVGGFIGAVLAITGWYAQKTKTFTRTEIAAKPFNGKLPTAVGMATTTAVALEGDNQYRQRVYGESAFSDNFADLMSYARVSDGTLLELQAALVIEPANPDSSCAVAVTAGGVVLGYIPQFESESLYNFLLQHRGMARVNANIHLRVSQNASYVEIDLVRPFRVVPGV